MTRSVKQQESYLRYVHKRCSKKDGHPTKEVAISHGRRHISKGAIGALWVYQCIYCQMWHLTRQDNGPGMAVHTVVCAA